MGGFVPHQLHALLGAAALDLEHLAALEPDQARVGEVERDRKARAVVGGEPIGGEPGVGPKAEAAPGEFFVECFESRLQGRALQLDAEV